LLALAESSSLSPIFKDDRKYIIALWPFIAISH
jgi:hypothetical protein